MFCKKAVLRNIRKIHRKTPVTESFFNKVTLAQVFSYEF